MTDGDIELTLLLPISSAMQVRQQDSQRRLM